MKTPARLAAVLLSFTFAGARILAQTPTQKPAQALVTVVVLDSHVDPSKPVPSVRVSLTYVDSGTRVTDARDVTNPKGEAFLQVSPDVPQRGDLSVQISGATNLVIYQPADGQLQGLGSKVTISLLPKGSPALLGPAQIEALLHRAVLQVSSLQKQAQASQKPDLSTALNAVAQAYGFAPADFNSKVESWAHDVQADPAADARKKALAELALKNYAGAAQLFTQATNADAASMDADEQKFLEGQRTKLRQLLTDAQQSANAAQLNLQYHQATSMLESALARAAATQKSFPDDAALHAIWLDATSAVAMARWREGEVTAADRSLPLLTQAAADFQALAPQYLAAGYKANSAATQLNLGNALSSEGERASGNKAPALLDLAVQAYRGALEVYTKADDPQHWALTQSNLGLAVLSQGGRTNEDKAPALFAQAMQAFSSALEVDTKAAYPQDWANTQDNLGLVLLDQGERATSKDKADAFYDQALQAFRNALQVQTKADSPQDWAGTQNHLGLALMDEGNWADEAGAVDHDKAIALLDQAVQALRSALEVYTQAALPQDWAQIQNNLGAALMREAERGGDKALALAGQAEQAFRNTLQVYTQAALPQDWARSQNNIGSALWLEGLVSSGDAATSFFNQAAQAYQGALQVYTKTADPYDWAGTMRNLSSTYKQLGNTAAAQQALADADSVDPQ